MLLRVIFENFLSFREPVQFDMFPNPKRVYHGGHVYAQDVPVLKMAAVYGANGSGKSNLIKGLDFIHNFVTSNDFFKETDISRFIHKGSAEVDSLACIVEFEAEGNYFVYSFRLSSERVVSEALYLSGKGQQDNTLIFRRELDGVEVGIAVDKNVQEAIDKLLLRNPTVSLLQLNEQFPIVPGDLVRVATRWLAQSLVIVPFNAVAVKLIDQMDKNPELLEFTNKVMSQIGLGLAGVNIKEELFENWIKNKGHQTYSSIPMQVEKDKVLGVTQDNRQIFIALKDKDRTIVKEFVFEHEGSEGKSFEMDINGESDGTVRLLNLIPALYGAVEYDKTIVIDEIDHSIHPILIFALVRFFAESQTKGQLVFTTHETCLLNQKVLLRADEVWFAEKIGGASKLYSLNDFKEHHTIAVENGYMNGRYGAVPYIGDTQWLV